LFEAALLNLLTTAVFLQLIAEPQDLSDSFIAYAQITEGRIASIALDGPQQPWIPECAGHYKRTLFQSRSMPATAGALVLNSANPTPIEARKQRVKLRVAQCHQAILNARHVNVCSSSRL
jgi:hypothetical protein